MGRSVLSLLLMLVTFTAIGAIFVALDAASGVPLHFPARSAAPAATPSPTPSAARTVAAPTASPTRPSAPAASATPDPLPSATPPTPTTTAPVPTALSPTVTAVVATATTPPTPSGTATPGAGATATTTTTTAATATATTEPTATATVTAAASITATTTVMPTPPGGITPPIYGTALNYTNNTAFTAAFMATLDRQIIALTNTQRTAHGLAPLAESGTLDIIAAARSEDLVKRDYFDHYDPTGPLDAQGRHAAAIQELLARNNVPYTEVGENLIGDTGYALDNATPQQAVQAWMHHPEHRANILHAGYTTIGVGMAAEDRSDGLRVVITQVFLR